MSRDEFQKLYCGNFAVDEREQKLYKRVAAYFQATDDVDYRTSEKLSRGLKAWCEQNGYSQGDLNRTKNYFNCYTAHTIN